MDKCRRYKTRTNKGHSICLPYLVPVIDHVGREKLVLFICLNANLGPVKSRPDEITV